jgi:hypothetical protein
MRRGVRFGGHDLDFSLGFSLVVFKRFFAQPLLFLAVGHGHPQQNGEKAGFDCCADMRAAEAPLDEELRGRKLPFTREHCSVSEGFPSNK